MTELRQFTKRLEKLLVCIIITLYLLLCAFWSVLERFKKDVTCISTEIFLVLTCSLAPGHIESILRYVALERRRGDYEKCAKLFKESIASAKEESHKVLLYIHFARFLASTESLDAARDVFDSALVEHPQFKSLWHAYLSFEKKISGDDKEERVNGIYARAVHGDHCMS